MPAKLARRCFENWVWVFSRSKLSLKGRRQMKPRIMVLASGEKEPGKGGSGFQEMIEYSLTDPPLLNATIAGVVSNHESGGVRTKADRFGIPFRHWAGPYTADGYKSKLEEFDAEWTMCSGWIFLVRGLVAKRTINIHPALLPMFGGHGFWGHHVHDAVDKAFRQGLITQTGVTMHFVTEPRDERDYDKGPIIWQQAICLREEDTPETIAKRVNEVERVCQSRILNEVIRGDHYLGDDGKVHHLGEQ